MKWFIALCALLSSLIIAGIAGWFSIVGMMALFGGSAMAAAIMMGSLEVGKIVTAAWLKNEWGETPRRLKYPLIIMVVVLMFVTSMGIFGFLSKAHIEQGAPVGNNLAKVERLEHKIRREQSIIDDSQIVIGQLDETVNTLIEYDRIRGPTGAKATRESQLEQRAELASVITTSEDNIDKFLDEKFEFEQIVREYEVEVGPVKYIAELVYTDTTNKLDSAVRIVIIILIFVFDPFAILLLVAANHSFIKLTKERQQRKKKITPTNRFVKRTEDLELIESVKKVKPQSPEIKIEKDKEEPIMEDKPEEPIIPSNELIEEHLIEKLESLPRGLPGVRRIPGDPNESNN